MTAPSASTAVGDVLAGKYRILRLLGRGGMGAVFAAEHQILGQEVAIKLLLDSPAQDSALVQRFVNEARAAAKIQGEHVVRVFDVDTLPDGKLFIAMELLDGEDLDSLAERLGTLEPTRAVDYMLQAMEALGQAHQLGIVHRDLKPSNLFLVVRPDGEHVIKVLDFGVAKVQSLPNVQAASTQTTALFGTPLYMSPEQIRSAKAADAQSDIWSLGVILFRLLTGRTPFSGETFGELCFSIAEQTAPLAHTLSEGVPPGLGDAVARCLERDKTRRFRTVGELAAALQPFASQDGARSADRIVATERASGVSAPVATTSAPARSAEPAVPAAPTAGNWSASQTRTGSGATARMGMVLALLGGFVVLAAGGAVAWHFHSAHPAASAVALPGVMSAAPAASAPVAPDAPGGGSAAASASAAPSSEPPASASALPSSKPPVVRPAPVSAAKPVVPRHHVPTHHTAKPASSGSGIVTNMGWN